jgi:alanyl-tRNA synthetase
VSKDLTDRIQASQVIGRLSPMVGGGGGGRPDMAQAGGKKPDGLPKLMKSVEGTLKELMG